MHDFYIRYVIFINREIEHFYWLLLLFILEYCKIIIMPSRKRNKGKERKAKKAEAIENVIEKLLASGWGGHVESSMGKEKIIHNAIMFVIYLMIPDDNHPVISFMDAFYINMRNRMGVEYNLRCTFQTQQQVWNNGDYRKLARDLMLVMGTNILC